MKILMVTPYLPYPPASGGQIRSLNLLKYLSKSHEITLVALYKTSEEKNYLAYLKPYCKEIFLCKRPEKPWKLSLVLKSVFSRKPFLIVRNFSDEAQAKIRDLLHNNQFDVIHSETFYVMPHIPKTTTPILLVEQTIEYKVYQHFVNNLNFFLRPLFNTDIVKLKYWERYYWKKASMVATVSANDKKIIHDVEPEISPVIIPNGAGDEMFVDKIEHKDLSHPSLLFIGNFFWLQNKEAADFLVEEVYPKLQKKLKNFSLIIAGQQANRINIPSFENVKIVDVPPDDEEMIKELYKHATLFVAPIFGPGGTRLKILAAMASGLPVIGTKTGFEGLDVYDGKHVVVANSASDFSDKIEAVLKDKSLFEKLQKNSFEKVKESYSWSNISKHLESVYKRIQKK